MAPDEGWRSPDTPAPALEARDLRGVDVPVDALPRWPVLTLAGELAEPEESLWLLRGDADPELVDDLATRPLRAAQLERAIDLVASPGEAGLTLRPREALEAGSYVLALAAWARDPRGQALAPEPLLWPLQVSGSPEAGARVRSTFPPDGTLSLGTNTEAVVIAFDGSLQENAEALWLELPSGYAVPADVDWGDCELPSGVVCATLRPQGRLPPNTSLQLRVGAELRDLHGGPVGPYAADFHIGPAADRSAPRIALPACAIDERQTPLGCTLLDEHSAQLRVELDEPASIEARVDGQVIRATGGPGVAVLRIAGLPAGATSELVLSLRDAAGNAAALSHPITTPAALATLSIVEVLADPEGPEPAQEWVELLNFGDRTIDLEGILVGDDLDDPGIPIARQALLPAGKRALLVSERFDPDDPSGVPPPPGALRIPLGRALTGDGLSNAGEALYLRDAEGHRLSASPGSPRPRAGRCLVRVGDELRSGAPEAFAQTAADGCTPGW